MPKKRRSKTKSQKPANPLSSIEISESEPSAGGDGPKDNPQGFSGCVTEWLKIYSRHAVLHEQISKLLIDSGCIVADGGSVFPQFKPIENVNPAVTATIQGQLQKLLDDFKADSYEERDISLRSNTPPTKATASMQTSPAHSPERAETPLVDAQLVDESRFLMDQSIMGVQDTKRMISCKLNNEFNVTLEFMNRGNNSAHDIETYLQEKLDVLDFLQQDHSAGRRETRDSSRLHLPPRPQEQPTSVSDWLNDTSSTTSAVSGGFFIGTPAPSVVAPDEDRSIHDVDAALLNDSQVRWETDSMISSASSPMRRTRDRSISLFSHYRGRDRVSRLAANSLDFGDPNDSGDDIENSYIENNSSVLGKSSGGFGFGTGSRWF